MVNSVAASDQSTRSLSTPTPWDTQTVHTARPPSRESNVRPQPRETTRDSRDTNGAPSTKDGRQRDSRDRSSRGDRGSRDRESRDRGGRDREQPPRDSRDGRDRDPRESRDSRDSRDRGASSRYDAQSRHNRNDSEATGPALSVGYPETALSGPPRRHDYDVQAMEANPLSPRQSVSRNPIPTPIVTVRSEFPTITRARNQQTLTCLITVEVPDNKKWKPDPEDLRGAPPPIPIVRPEDSYARPPSPAQSGPRFYPYESPEVLEEMTESLRIRVDNWHGLDFAR